MYNKKQLVEILSQKKKKLLEKKKRIISKMEEENSALETQIAKLQNRAVANRADAIKRANIITPKIDKLIRDIKSARQYVDEVTEKELEDHEKEKREENAAQVLKNGPEMLDLDKYYEEEKEKVCKKKSKK